MSDIKNKIVLIFIGFFLVSVNLANADSAIKREGFYVGGLIGINKLDDLNFDLSNYYNPPVNYDFDTGYNVGAQFGYKFGNGFRIDLGLRHSDSQGQYDIQDATTQIFGRDSLVGTEDISSSSAMLNGYYDFFNKSRFTPFLGMGLGVSHLKGDSIRITDYPVPNPSCFPSGPGLPVVCVSPRPNHLFVSRDHSDNALSYSLMTGFNFDISKNFTLGLEYKYLSALNANFSSLDFDYNIHNIDLKISYHF